MHDPHQNQIRDLSTSTSTWLLSKLNRKIHSIHSEGPHAGPKGHHHHLVVLAVDTPETDSHIKQLAAHIGGLTNHQSTLVSKEGPMGMQAWHIPNKMYDGGPAHPHALESMITKGPSL